MRIRNAIIAAAVCVLVPACGETGTSIGVESIGSLQVGVPKTVLGLDVEQEDVLEALRGARPAYADAVALYSYRDDELLEATLQVTRFTPDIEIDDRFRDSVVNRLGGATPRLFRAGDHLVYETTSTGQVLDVWFSGRYMFVLAIREDFRLPAALLRSALEVSA